jgi:insulin receptor substrate 1
LFIFVFSMYQGSSSAHSRASSLAEENTDAYVPMAAHPQDSYVEMDGHPHHHHHHQRNDGMSSAASSCSITSGTPSTDMRFSEYPLEKVVSAFAQSEDDECNADMRPLRTYSVGSRLEHNKRKMRVDVINAELISSQSNPRVRAFSVGSRAKVPRSELYKSPLTHNAQQIGIANTSAGAAAVAANKKGKKSSSAPILVKFPDSIDRMDDLMEIDYSKNSSTPVKTSSPVPVPKVKHYMSDGIDMSPRTGRIAAPSGYVEMKPGNVPAKSSLNEHDYLDMTVGGAGSGATNVPYILSGSPIMRSLTATSPKELGFNTLKINNNNNDDYIDMSPKTSSVASYKSISKHNIISESPKTSSDDYLNMSPGEKMLEAMGSLPKSNDSSSVPDGYMEMSWNQNKHKTSNDGYNNSTNYGKTPQHLDSRLSSQPINIQAKSGAGGVRPTKVLATATAVPGNFLPPGQTINGQSGHSPGKSITARCDSRDSGIATPSGSHPTIFAFSPSSPKKPFIVPSASGLAEVRIFRS